MRQDIDGALRGWHYKSETVQARLIRAKDGREILQMRVELGVMQLEVADRPDGSRPHGQPTYFAYLRAKAKAADLAGRNFRLNEQHSLEADREFMQYYHRRVCWLSLGEYNRAVEDADHTLSFMDFVRDHSPSEEFTRSHEQYRGFVLFHRTQAAAAAFATADDPESAINSIRVGFGKIESFLMNFDADAEPDSDPMLMQLRRLEAEIRERHNLGETLQEKLDRAIASEDYEAAAQLRDSIRQKSEPRTVESEEA